jgi:phosphoribosylglycinamide formyltransferase-1
MTVYNFRLVLSWNAMLDPQKLRPRFVILISGQGSNMQALVQACQSGDCAADVAAVIASRAETAGLAWAAAQGIHTVGLAHTAYPNRDTFDAALAETIDQFSPDYVLLAGFMRVLTPGFVERFAGRLINIHPSLLPSFPGLHTHAQALATGVQSHGCTVHFVTPVLDHGPIIAQGVVPVHHLDTPETLATRVLGMEHIIYPQVACWLAQGRVHLTSDQRVLVDGVTTRLFTSGQHL